MVGFTHRIPKSVGSKRILTVAQILDPLRRYNADTGHVVGVYVAAFCRLLCPFLKLAINLTVVP